MTTITRPVAGELEQRAAPDIELDDRRLRGLVPYGTESRDLGGWREVLSPGCLRDARLDDLVATVDHAGVPIGRYPTTLEVEDRDDGLHWTVVLPDSRGDVREAVERRDLRSSSWRMIVRRDEWRGDVRHIHEIAELRDVAVVTNPAYETATAEYRSHQEEPMSETATVEPEAEERTTPDPPQERQPPPAASGRLRVEDRETPAAGRCLADEFRSRGFPGETATLDFGRVFYAEERAATWTGSVDNLNPTRRGGVGLAFDQRYAWPAFGRIGVDPGTTAVQVMRQSQRTLAAAADVIRAIDATTPKPETSSKLEVITVALKQVASIQSGIPNVYLEQPLFNTVIEGDLRLAVNEALDKLVLDATAASPSQDPGTDSLVVAVRHAITILQGLGYSPDTLILTPQASEDLDTLTATPTDEIYVFSPGQPAPGIWGLSRRVSKSVAAPIVVDTTAFGKLYASAISLARFEENSGETNTSLVRLEGHAAFGVERQDAAVRLAAAA
jgi:HK97 family phage prohead protease